MPSKEKEIDPSLEEEIKKEKEPVNILQFLEKNRPKEDKERPEDLHELGLIESFEDKVAQYKANLIEKGLQEGDAHELAIDYGYELKNALQDPREYVRLMNRTGASGRLSEELTRAIPKERQLERADFRRVFRLDLDLDEFKTFNDYYGHKAGDEILRVFSQEILENGEAINWLQECGALDGRGEKEPPAFEKSAEGGEEFGAMVVLKKEFTPIKAKLEDGTDTELETHQDVVEEFSRRLQAECKKRFQDVITQKNDKGELVFPRLEDFPKNFPRDEFTEEELENFVFESGVSVGYASAEDAASETDDITENDTFESVLEKIKGRMFKQSDTLSLKNKEDKKDKRMDMVVAKKGSPDSRITAYISPRGRVDTAEGKLSLLQAESGKTKELLGELGKETIADLETISELKSNIAQLEIQAQGLDTFKGIIQGFKDNTQKLEDRIKAREEKIMKILNPDTK